MGIARATARRRSAVLAVALGAAAGSVGGDADAAAAAEHAEVRTPFELRSTSITPKRPLLDGRRKIALRYGFGARGRTDLEVHVIRVASGNTVRVWRERRARPGRRLRREWNGLNRRGDAVPDGRYAFAVGPQGARLRRAGSLRLHGHVFPVEGPHGTRGSIGDYGAPRNGGRSHEGFDVTGACGTPLVAARGGTIAKAGYDPRLYGYFLLINGWKTDRTYFYSHLISPSEAGRGERVHTGERVGQIGRTGNAASTPCHLHFEMRRGGRPLDPEPALRRWDAWS